MITNANINTLLKLSKEYPDQTISQVVSILESHASKQVRKHTELFNERCKTINSYVGKYYLYNIGLNTYLLNVIGTRVSKTKERIEFKCVDTMIGSYYVSNDIGDTKLFIDISKLIDDDGQLKKNIHEIDIDTYNNALESLNTLRELYKIIK